MAPVRTTALLQPAPVAEGALELPAAPEAEDIHWDYAALGLSLRRHPLALLRPRLDAHHFRSATALPQVRNGQMVRVCGLVTLRQQPPTAKGVVFVTLEDETGNVQVICWPALRNRQRDVLLQSRLLAVRGRWPQVGDVGNLIALELRDMSHWLNGLWTQSRDFK